MPGVAVRRPIAPEQGIGELRQRDRAVLGAFALVAVDHLFRAVDIGDFKKQPFLEVETAGVDSHRVDVVVEGGDPGQELFDFFAKEHSGQTLFPFDPGKMQEMPVFFQNIPATQISLLRSAHWQWGPPPTNG